MSSGEKKIASLDEMRMYAHDLTRELQGGQILLLRGELGAGKTTLVQGIAAALGVAADLTSPTFTIMGEYAATLHPTITRLVHLDLYRLTAEQAQQDALIDEVISDATEPATITIIEWADRLGDKIPITARQLLLRHGDTPQERIISLEG